MARTPAASAVLLAILSACGDPSEPRDASPISMIAPFPDPAAMGPIREAFSASAAAPWGFVHTGIDFFPLADGSPFQAVAAGRVEQVQLIQNSGSGNWQVNVSVRFNDAYVVFYVFEPMSALEADGEAQLAEVLVSAGDVVAPGDTLATLHSAAPGAHLDLGLLKDHQRICPEPYFTQAAKDAILQLLDAQWPAADMCYP